MMKKLIIVTLALLSTLTVINATGNIVHDLLQYNVAGVPVLFKKENWTVDPDVALRRRKQFEELNGIKGEKLIERLGLGIDGYADERLEQQKIRDEGHLGGLNYFQP